MRLSRCGTSRATCRRRWSTPNGSSPATSPRTPPSCRSPAGSRPAWAVATISSSSIAVFTIASALCGMATSLWQIILFRVIQGLAGGGLQPSSQAILIDSFPPEKQGTAMTMFGIAALTAPVVGPTLGGYLSDYQNWRWIFYINIPIGGLAFLIILLRRQRSGLSPAGACPSCGECRSISTTSAWGSWRWSCPPGKC